MGYDPVGPLIQPFSKVRVRSAAIASTEGLIFPRAHLHPRYQGTTLSRVRRYGR
jgi:hypothetical protein